MGFSGGPYVGIFNSVGGYFCILYSMNRSRRIETGTGPKPESTICHEARGFMGWFSIPRPELFLVIVMRNSGKWFCSLDAIPCNVRHMAVEADGILPSPTS